MKKLKLLFTLFICLAISSSNAQTLVVDTAANWQQYISTILGGTCVQISNVSFTGNPRSAGLYQSLQGFADGILLTTGQAIDAQGPNNTGGAGISLNTNGDTLLSYVLNQSNSLSDVTNDATIIEFDFVASTTGPVTVDYVFASEEYPEFVNSSFNDVFGFFVWENSNPSQFQNIALVPGTTLPVAINNVNYLLNSQYYIDNDAIFVDTTYISPINTQYDGLTVPLTATFNAVAGVSYHLKIAIADVSDGILDSGVFLKTFNTINQPFVGNVTHQGSPAQAGLVELFGLNTDSTEAPLITTANITNGSYDLGLQPSGDYIVRITLDPILYPNSVPTYYQSAVLWSDATIVSVPCENFSVDAPLFVLNNGGGQVFGTVGDVMQKSGQQNGPRENAHVFLFNTATNALAGFAKTNAMGEYTFTNLANGEYKIVVDIPGVPMLTTQMVEITSQPQNVTAQNYYVTPNGITYQLTSVENNTALSTLGLYPNPVGNSLNLSLGVKEQTTLTATITNLTGQTLATVYNGNVSAGMQTIAVNTQSLSNGVYFMNINANGFSKTIRFVKQ